MGTAEHINLPEYLFQIPKTQNYLICYIDLLPNAEYLLTKGYKEFCVKAKKETDIKILQKYNWHIRYLHIAKNIFNEYYGEFNPIRWDEET